MLPAQTKEGLGIQVGAFLSPTLRQPHAPQEPSSLCLTPFSATPSSPSTATGHPLDWI